MNIFGFNISISRNRRPVTKDGTKGSESQLPVLDFIASTATLDRYQEVIEPGGWRLESYRKNPVFQNAHNYGDILFTLGRALSTEVRDVNGGLALCQRIEFATQVSPIARIAYGLYKGRFLNAVSVGFIPLRWEDAQGNEHTGRVRSPSGPPHALGRVRSPSGPPHSIITPGNGRLGEATLPGELRGALGERALPRRRLIEQELLEVSAVAIPANPDALALGLKSGAIAEGLP